MIWPNVCDLLRISELYSFFNTVSTIWYKNEGSNQIERGIRLNLQARNSPSMFTLSFWWSFMSEIGSYDTCVSAGAWVKRGGSNSLENFIWLKNEKKTISKQLQSLPTFSWQWWPVVSKTL